MKPTVYFRTDGNNNIGYGHFFRCLSIAECASEKFNVVFLLRNSNSFIHQQLQANKLEFIQLETTSLLEEAEFIASNILSPSSQIVMDGYEFQSDYQTLIKRSGARLIYVDDLHAWPIVSDALINHSPGIGVGHYRQIAKTGIRYFLGLEYALIRKCFTNHVDEERKDRSFKDILICLGGVDFNLTIKKIIDTFDQVSTVRRITVVTSVPDGFSKREKVKILSNQSGPELANLMAQHQLMICPPSTLSIEAFFSRMCLMLVQTSDNQKDILTGLMQFENVKSLGTLESVGTRDFEMIESDLKRWEAENTLLKPFPIKFERRKLLNIFEE